MVWNRRYVRTHSNYRVNIGSSILDLSSLIGVGVIAGPSLRSKVQHAWIKSGSSAGAGFKKNLRKFCSQTGIQIIDAQHIPMHSLALAIRISRPAVRLCHIPVHIPFDVGNGRLSDNHRDHFINVIYNFLSGEIQHMLMSCMTFKPARCRNQPIRMPPVKVTVFIYHFQFYPQAKLQSHIFNLSGQSGNTFRQFFKIGIPVSQTSVIIISGSEPAVIQNKKLCAGFLCLFGNVQDLFLIKVKIGGFPVIQQDRTGLISPDSSHKPFSVQPMIYLAHLVQAMVAVYHNCFRSLKAFSFFENPRKVLRMNAHQHSGHIKGRHLCLDQKITAVDKTKSVNFPVILS